MKKMLLFSALSTLLFVTACRKDVSSPDAGVNTPINQQGAVKSEWRTAYYRGSLIHYQRINGQNIWDGDMVLSDDQLSATPQIISSATGTPNPDYLWPNATIHYMFTAEMPATGRAKVREAMDDWTNATGFTFVEITSPFTVEHYLTIKFSVPSPYIDGTRDNSSASVGMNANNENNVVQIVQGFEHLKGITAHELGHAMGLDHEHLRPDRDSYINILLSNIIDGYQGNYDITTNNDYAGTSFDFASIMLYGSFTFAAEPTNSNRPVMTKKDGSTWIYNAEKGTQKCSADDANWIKRKYNLTGGTTGGIVAGNTYIMRAYGNNNMVIDVQGGNAANGTPVWLYVYNGTDAQKWTFTDAGNGYFIIRSKLNPNKVLDISGGQTDNGTQMQIWDWDNVLQQKWQPVSVGGGYYKLIPALASNKAIDLSNGGTTDGTKIQLWDDVNNNNQKWKIEESSY